MGKLKIYPQWGTEMYESNHPSEKRGLFVQEIPQKSFFFVGGIFFFFFSQGLVCITNEKACLIIKCEPEEHGILEGVLV